ARMMPPALLAAPGGSSSHHAPSSSTTSNSVGTRPPTTAASLTAPAAPTTTAGSRSAPVTSATLTSGPLAALQEFAAALNAGDYARIARVTTGPMVALSTVQNLNREYSIQHGSPYYPVTAAARGLTRGSVVSPNPTGPG